LFFCNFLIDSVLRVDFDIPEDEAGEIYQLMKNGQFSFDNNTIFLGEAAETPLLLTKKIIGYDIDTYEEVLDD
jgi:hypothetical protein